MSFLTLIDRETKEVVLKAKVSRKIGEISFQYSSVAIDYFRVDEKPFTVAQFLRMPKRDLIKVLSSLTVDDFNELVDIVNKARAKNKYLSDRHYEKFVEVTDKCSELESESA